MPSDGRSNGETIQIFLPLQHIRTAGMTGMTCYVTLISTGPAELELDHDVSPHFNISITVFCRKVVAPGLHETSSTHVYIILHGASLQRPV